MTRWSQIFVILLEKLRRQVNEVKHFNNLNIDRQNLHDSIVTLLTCRYSTLELSIVMLQLYFFSNKKWEFFQQKGKGKKLVCDLSIIIYVRLDVGKSCLIAKQKTEMFIISDLIITVNKQDIDNVYTFLHLTIYCVHTLNHLNICTNMN
jgi:hypothetical protein